MMNPKAFTESGILEIYVLGQCTPEETVEVERMIAEHPEVRDELTAIEQALENYAAENATSPPVGLKEQILNRIDLERGVGTSVNQPVLTAPSVTPAPLPVASAAPSSLLRFGLIGLALAAALLGYMAWQNGQKNLRLQEERDGLQQKLDECDRRGESNQHIQEEIAYLRDPATTTIRLIDQKNPLGHPALVFHHVKDNIIRLDMASMPQPPPTRRLQLWAFVGGKPKSMGMVDNIQGAGLWRTLSYMPGAEGFAISAELEEVESPTMEQVLMVSES